MTPSETETLKMFDDLLKDFLIQQLAWEKSRHPEQFGMIDGSPVLQEMAEKRYDAIKDLFLTHLRLARADERKQAYEDGKNAAVDYIKKNTLAKYKVYDDILKKESQFASDMHNAYIVPIYVLENARKENLLS